MRGHSLAIALSFHFPSGMASDGVVTPSDQIVFNTLLYKVFSFRYVGREALPDSYQISSLTLFLSPISYSTGANDSRP
jgi:hypothetical protein